MCELEKAFSENLKYLRNKAGLTQKQLAERIKVNRNNISCWETGVSCPNTSTLSVIAKYFHLKIDDLLLFNLNITKTSRFKVVNKTANV